jgi:hypothetical protein
MHWPSGQARQRVYPGEQRAHLESHPGIWHNQPEIWPFHSKKGHNKKRFKLESIYRNYEGIIRGLFQEGGGILLWLQLKRRKPERLLLTLNGARDAGSA